MKRHKHPLNNPNCTLWEAICDMDNLKLAHKNAKKGKGWLKWCDSYRLSEKYITPLQPFADAYYENNIKRKVG